jgi:Uma2 family endonuclease
MSTAALKLGPLDAGRQLSAEEFASASYQAPFRYERVKRRLVVSQPAGADDRQVSRPFRRVLGGYWGTHPESVDDVDLPGWVSTTPDDDRIPDICVYLADKCSSLRVPQRVPDLIFEFVSQDRSDQERDYIDKRAEYHAIRVKEYVIVDRFKQQVLVLTWKRADYAERVLTCDQQYTSPLLPGLAVSLAEVFE